jgi:probable O-glycosylation ligase (exosortase A-associated)
MRDFLVLLTVIGSVPLTLVRPHIGILMYFWISLMNPHRLTWGYAYQFRVAMVVAVATMVAWLFSRSPKAPPASPVNFVLGLFTLWVSITTIFALVPDDAFNRWQADIKILGMTFVTTCLIQTKERIRQLVWVIALSIGYYGIRGGMFSIVTGGNYRVFGPDESFISDNNALALAEIMILPLLEYLRLTVGNRWVRLGLLGAMGLTMISVLGSYSRGALVGLLPTLFVLWLRTKYRAVTAIATGAVLVAALSFMPASWYERMHTIETYQKDSSAMGRIAAWHFALGLAGDYPFGGGFDVVHNDRLYYHYNPDADISHNFHSIYFQAIGEHGWIGFVIFVSLLISALMTGRWVTRQTRGRPDLAWASDLARMAQVSVLGYCISGAFLNLGFYDLLYALLAVLVSTRFVVAQTLKAGVGEHRPIAVPAPEPVPPLMVGQAAHRTAL